MAFWFLYPFCFMKCSLNFPSDTTHRVWLKEIFQIKFNFRACLVQSAGRKCDGICDVITECQWLLSYQCNHDISYLLSL